MVNAGYIEPPTATTGSTPFVEATAKRALARTSKNPIVSRTAIEPETAASRGREIRSAIATVATPPTRTARTAQPGRSAAARSSPGEEDPEAEARENRQHDRATGDAGMLRALLVAQDDHSGDRGDETHELDRGGRITPGEADGHRDDHPERRDRSDHADRAHGHRRVEGPQPPSDAAPARAAIASLPPEIGSAPNSRITIPIRISPAGWETASTPSTGSRRLVRPPRKSEIPQEKAKRD